MYDYITNGTPLPQTFRIILNGTYYEGENITYRHSTITSMLMPFPKVDYKTYRLARPVTAPLDPFSHYFHVHVRPFTATLEMSRSMSPLYVQLINIAK